MNDFERRLCQLIADGYNSRDAAREMDYKVRTMEAKLAVLKHRWDAYTLPQLIAKLIRAGEIK